MQKLIEIVENITAGRDINLTETEIEDLSEVLKANISAFDTLESDIKDIKLKIKVECLLRMILLKVHQNVIMEFINDNRIYLSQFDGILYWLSETQMEYVNELQESCSGNVYHCIVTNTMFGTLFNMMYGTLFNMMYVCNNYEEWQMDREDLLNGHSVAYCKNLDDESCSEFGGIGIKENVGGLCRIY